MIGTTLALKILGKSQGVSRFWSENLVSNWYREKTSQRVCFSALQNLTIIRVKRATKKVRFEVRRAHYEKKMSS